MMSEALLVVGVCDPERNRYAHRVARLRHRLVRFEPGGPRHGAARERSWSAHDPVVVEAATDVDVPHLMGAEPAPAVVCVVDAVHMIDDLCDTVALAETSAPGDDRGDVGSRARQAASFIEAASLVALVNWQTVDTPKLSILMALASHLSPTAQIRLSRDPQDDLRSASPVGEAQWQARAGWVRALNGEHDPYMTDRRVTTFRYEQMRPFHPGRLARVLEEGLQPDRVGLVLRSAGFCRLATRLTSLARWEQVGSAMWMDAIRSDDRMASTVQEIAFTGLDLQPHRIRAALDAAALTDAELLAGPSLWDGFDDPLPAWPINATDEADRTEG